MNAFIYNSKIAIVGYGRMGQLIEQKIKENNIKYKDISAPLEYKVILRNALSYQSLKDISSVICFPNPDSGYQVSKFILESGKNLVLGTTGFYRHADGLKNQGMLDELNKIAVKSGSCSVYTSNFSEGVNLFWRNLNSLAKNLRSYYDPIVIEAHHIEKKDSPSGTALSCGDILLSVYTEHLFNSKKGFQLIRSDNIARCLKDSLDKTYFLAMKEEIQSAKDKIPIISIRHGDIPGTHRVIFIGKDLISLDNIALSRDEFAYGALSASEWLAYKIKKGFMPAGFHCIEGNLLSY